MFIAVLYILYTYKLWEVYYIIINYTHI
jgi:hypothetical protein